MNVETIIIRAEGEHVVLEVEGDGKITELCRERLDSAFSHGVHLRKHIYWGAGGPDCPREIKAGNGELHTLRCKVCGLDRGRGAFCIKGSSTEGK